MQLNGTGSTGYDSDEGVLKRFREALRLRNYARSTEKTYINWVRGYLRYCKGRVSSIHQLLHNMAVIDQNDTIKACDIYGSYAVLSTTYGFHGQRVIIEGDLPKIIE